MLAALILATAACAGPAAPTLGAARPSSAPTASADGSTSTPTASMGLLSTAPAVSYPPYQKATVPPVDTNHLRTGPAHPVTGVAYPFDMYAHCNGVWVRFGGSYWLAETPLAVS